MWNFLKPLIDKNKLMKQKGKGLGALSQELKKEFSLLERAKEIHAAKARLFNDLVLKLYTREESEAILALKNYMKRVDLLNNASDFEKSVTDFEEKSGAVLEKKSIRRVRAARYLVQNIQKFLKSEEFEDYKRQLFIQKAIIEGDRVRRHIAEFKHALQREGEIILHESYELTQIEDRMLELLAMTDPYEKVDANTVVSIVKQIFILYGLHDFRISPTGSTARGTAVKGSDYDIVIWTPKEDLLKLKSAKFADFFNEQAAKLIATVPDISNLALKNRWIYSKYLMVQMIEGKITVKGSTSSISLECTDDLDHFADLILYATSHKRWILAATKRRRQRFLADVKTLKSLLRSVGLYSNYQNIFKGYYIETILANSRLKHFFIDVVSKCLPWSKKSIQSLTEVLIEHGLTGEDAADLLEKRYPTSTDDRTVRAILLILTAKRYLENKGPGLDLEDVASIYPYNLCVDLTLVEPRNVNSFYELTNQVLPVETIIQVPDGMNLKCFIVLKENKRIGKAFHYNRTLRTGQAKTFLKEDRSKIRRAALASRKSVPKGNFRSKILETYRQILIEHSKV